MKYLCHIVVAQFAAALMPAWANDGDGSSQGGASSIFGEAALAVEPLFLLDIRGAGSTMPPSAVNNNQVVFNGPATLNQANNIHGSFNGAAGIFTIVQNSGNNASLNIQTNVFITIH